MGMACVLQRIDAVDVDRLRTDPAAVEECLDDEAADAADLDKSWHAIHFLLSGDPAGGEEPACYLLAGGEEVGEDLGYGPARLLTPEQVHSFDALLATLPAATLRARFDPDALHQADIYPREIWKRDPIEESWEYIEHWYDQLRDLVRRASESQAALLIYLT